MFLKTHKTGSSSIHNALWRYANTHNLLVALMQIMDVNITESFNRNMVVEPEIVERKLNTTFSMIVEHMIFNETEVAAIMPEDTVYVTVLRDPVSQFKSMYNFYKPIRSDCFDNESLSSFADALLLAIQNRTSTSWGRFNCRSGNKGRNQMSLDLGLDPTLFDYPPAVRHLIDDIDRRFDLVMITERMDESTILLKHLLCWSTRDVIFFNVYRRVNSAEEDRLTPEQEDALRRLNHADNLLYQHFANKLDNAVREFGNERMVEEVNQLRKERKRLFDDCVGSLTPQEGVLYTPIYVMNVKKETHDPELCNLLTNSDDLHLPTLRKQETQLKDAFLAFLSKEVLVPGRH